MTEAAATASTATATAPAAAAAATPAAGSPATTPAAQPQGAPAAAAPASSQPAAAAAPKPWAPSVPQGSLLEAGYVKGLQDLAAAKGIPAEAAQAFLEHQHAATMALIDQAKAERAGWNEELAKDPTIGGDKLAGVKAEALAAVDKAFGPHAAAFKDLLSKTGYVDNPVIVRALAHAATLFRDDSFVGKAGAAAAGKPSEDQLLKSRYPSMATAAA